MYRQRSVRILPIITVLFQLTWNFDSPIFTEIDAKEDYLFGTLKSRQKRTFPFALIGAYRRQ